MDDLDAAGALRQLLRRDAGDALGEDLSVGAALCSADHAGLGHLATAGSRRDRRSIPEEPELEWDDMRAVLLLLMEIRATLERIERLLEDEDGEENADA